MLTVRQEQELRASACSRLMTAVRRWLDSIPHLQSLLVLLTLNNSRILDWSFAESFDLYPKGI